MTRPNNATLKQLLKTRFPATKFSVRAGRGTSRSWTHVSWTDGPTERLVEDMLADVGSAPGYMDQTDYFNGERVSVSRSSSDIHRQRVAQTLLGSKPVPPQEAWSWQVRRANGGGYNDLHCIVNRAIYRREEIDRHRFDANAWLEAWAHGSHIAPDSVVYA